LADRYSLSTPPNLTVIVKDPYNKPVKPRKTADAPFADEKNNMKQTPSINMNTPTDISQHEYAPSPDSIQLSYLNDPPPPEPEEQQLDWAAYAQAYESDDQNPF